jgi:hypothetical protein
MMRKGSLLFVNHAARPGSDGAAMPRHHRDAKKQKNFMTLGHAFGGRGSHTGAKRIKSFLVVFFKKKPPSLGMP